MANIDQYLQDILDAIYGEEVRGSIHDAIAEMNIESTNAEAVAISSRDSAKRNAEKAQASQEAAATSEAAALASEQAAATSEANAATSETNAAASEAAALASEQAAATSEANAAASEAAALASEQAAATSETNAAASEQAAATSEANAAASATTASAAATRAESARDTAERIVEDLGYPIDPKGPITFSQLPTTGMKYGWMYQITDSFTTDARFVEGAGQYCSENTEVYYTSQNKWAIMGSPGGVTGIKGAGEPAGTDYHRGQVTITPEMIGVDPNAGRWVGTYAEYLEEKDDITPGTEVVITDWEENGQLRFPASQVSYSNNTSGASATDAQSGLDEAFSDIDDVNDEIAQMKVDFQDGVDTIYNSVVAKGSTPTASTPSAIATAVANIPNSNSATYTFASGDTGGTKDLGVANDYRYVNASNVYSKGSSDGYTSGYNTAIARTFTITYTESTTSLTLFVKDASSVRVTLYGSSGTYYISGGATASGSFTIISYGTISSAGYGGKTISNPSSSGYNFIRGNMNGATSIKFDITYKNQ